MSGLRLGIVGARRVRQGLGPFIARDLARLGHRVTAVLGRSHGSARAAAEDVRAASEQQPEPFTDRAAFLASGLDAVVVATPAGTHLAEVEAALGAGLHVLAEKPLLWHPERDWAGTAAALEDRAHAAGVVLAANAQWPWTLDAFAGLFGLERAELGGTERLAMGLAPASTGRQMIGDALPHPMSVAQALRPDLESAADIRFERDDEPRLLVRANLEGERGALALEVELDGAAAASPRRAWLALDGRRAERCVRPRDYALFLRDGARLVDLPDPLLARLSAFCGDATRGSRTAPAPDRTLSRRAAMLAAIDAAYADAFGPG